MMYKNKIIALLSITAIMFISVWIYSVVTKNDLAAPVTLQHTAVKDVAVISNNTLLNARPVVQVSQQPTYITEIEWQVLQQIAQQKSPTEEALVHLVNNLRFVKQVELWHSLVKTNPEAQALAELLLTDIPTRVQQQDLDQQQAQQLQQELISILTVDANARHQRITTEAKRIGVTIEIESH
ncbi:MAG: hypothetical protein Q7S87_03755 [Agitococcus sp.]|nr:hypothetical protein [Agitococcus sp.]MDO9180168.1 hypothetical protein [Agitococcus sp.]